MGKLVLDAIHARLNALEHHLLGHTRRRETRTERARRKGVSTRTITRHVEAVIENQPDIINGRWYFWVNETDEQPQPDTAAAREARNPRLRKPAPTSSEF